MGTDEKLVPGQLLMSGILASYEKNVIRLKHDQQIQQVVAEPRGCDAIYLSVYKYQNEEIANV